MFLLQFIFKLVCIVVKSLLTTFVTLFIIITIYSLLVNNKYLPNYADNLKVNKEQTQICYIK